jgi:hypothetical protein
MIQTPSKSILSASQSLSTQDLFPTPSKTAPSPSGPPSPVPGYRPHPHHHPHHPHGQHTAIATSPHPPVLAVTITVSDTPLIAAAVSDAPLLPITISNTTLATANSSTVPTNLGFFKEKGRKAYGYVGIAGEYCSDVVGRWGGVAGGVEVIWVAWGKATGNTLFGELFILVFFLLPFPLVFPSTSPHSPGCLSFSTCHFMSCPCFSICA